MTKLAFNAEGSSMEEGKEEKTQDSETSSAPSGKEELLKGVDSMKKHFQGKEEMEKVQIRRPKKLERTWNPNTDEALEEPLPATYREQELAPLSIVGTDFSRSRYEKNVEHKEQFPRESQFPSIPVNRKVVEKVAPPEITKSVRSLFESGNFSDLHNAQKLNIDIHDGDKGAGVYESKPVELEGVTRESDFQMEGEELEKGVTKNMVEEWKAKKDDFNLQRGEVVLAEDEGKILESNPEQRTDVVRECDIHPFDELVIERGHAANLMKKFLNCQEGPKEQKVIKLVENEEENAVFESTPVQSEPGVVRSGEEVDDTQFERGKAKNLAGYWAARTDEVDVKRGPIKLYEEHDDVGPAVLESQPEVLDGVVRGSDILQDELTVNLSSGHAKNIANRWGKADDDGPKGPKQPIKMDLAEDGPSVLENTPIELEGVIRSDMVVEDVIPGNRGRTKDIASAFLRSEEGDTRPRQPIQIERSDGPAILENEPAPPAEGVIRSDSCNVQEVQLDTGRTKNLLDHWGAKERDNLTPKTSAAGGEKPAWIKEIEAARESGVFENEPVENTDVIRESDVAECEKEQCIPDNYTQSLKTQWVQKQIEEERIKRNEQVPELVCFTPPREVTPPPVNQQEYQSVQTMTFSSKPQEPQVNGYETQEQYTIDQSGPPNESVASSFSVVLK